jgi:hypothetical protein
LGIALRLFLESADNPPTNCPGRALDKEHQHATQEQQVMPQHVKTRVEKCRFPVFGLAVERGILVPGNKEQF